MCRNICICLSIIALLPVLLSAACGGTQGSGLSDTAVNLGTVADAQFDQILDFPVRQTSAQQYPAKAMGKDYLPDIGCGNCAVAGDSMVFSPQTGGEQQALQDAAYCVFPMGLTGGLTDTTITLVWNGSAPATGNCWLGLSNFTSERWEWQQLGSAEVPLAGAAEYADGSGNVYAALVILGSDQRTLTSIELPKDGGGGEGGMTIDQTISDGAQRTTLAFSGLAMITGNLPAQSFFPPGKVADYTGFQYLRDNDPDSMGHNTSFLTRIANNVIYILNDTQFDQLVDLAVAQQEDIELYGYKRYPLMKAFRRLLDDELPAGSSGLNLNAVKAASRELYILDGQISFDRAMLYVAILNSMDPSQIEYLDSMKGQGWNSWPDITDEQIRDKMQGLPQGSSVAVMTYASDLFSWYAGSVTADVYFCPERQGTYYGGFYIKDAPAIGHEGYSIDEQLTATAGAALCDASKGYVTEAQAQLFSSLVETQRDNLYAGTTNIVGVRTQVATLLRGLLESTANADEVEQQVLDLSATYGELDGENNYYYATVIDQVYESLSQEQKDKLMELRQSIMSGTYDDGTPFDFTYCTTYYLYSQQISDESILDPYIGNTDSLFFEP